MPALVIPRTFLITCSGTNQGTPWANVFGFSPNDPDVVLSQADVDEIANDFRAFYVAINGLISDDWLLSSVQLADVRTATSPSWEASISSLAGGSTVDALSPQTAMVASHRTGLRGKSYSGRTYLSGFTESSNTPDGGIDSTSRTTVVNAFDALDDNLAGLVGAPGNRAVVSRKLLESNVIVSTSIDFEWDRQTRRKRT